MRARQQLDGGCDVCHAESRRCVAPRANLRVAAPTSGRLRQLEWRRADFVTVTAVRLAPSNWVAVRGDRPRAVFGTWPVAYLLAFGKWGSYAHLPKVPIYAGDVAILGSFLLASRSAALRQAWRHLNPRLFLPAILLVGWSVARFLTGDSHGLVALRDFAPYLYALVIVLPIKSRDPGSRRSITIIYLALAIHVLWLTFALAVPDRSTALPALGGGQHLFSLRHDFDAACAALFAGVAALYSLRQARRGAQAAHLSMWLAGVAMVAWIGSRAGLLALAATGAVVTIAAWRSRAGSFQLRSLGRWLAAGSVAVAVLAAVPPSTAGSVAIGHRPHSIMQRLLSTAAVWSKTSSAAPSHPDAGSITSTNSATSADPNAVGTAKARLRAWRAVARYTAQPHYRLVLGVGFGPDFLHQSGAASSLEGTEYQNVRSPHNFLVTTLARLGLVGLLILLGLLGQLLFLVVRVMRRRSQPILVGLAVQLLLAVLVAALVGVVLESPFGAIPFFWAAGLVLAAAQDHDGRPRGSTSASEYTARVGQARRSP